jgi:phospholipid-translocating ATPase
MYDKASNTPTICNTQTIFENLGQVNYIFTDKTGTLTENVMRFRKMSVAGIAWRHDIPDRTKTRIRSEYEPQIPTQKEIESRQYAKTSPTSCKELPAVTVSKMPDDAVQVHQKSEFTTAHTQDEPLTSELLDFLRTNPHTVLSQKIKTFLLSLALCHTCFPEVQENGEIGFQAESPDELALVEAAQDLGYLLIDRSARSIHLLTHPSNSQVAIQETYEILQVVEFSSTRKRMSIIVRLPDGRICIFCKGADSVIQHRLKLASLAQEKAARVEHIHDERVHEEANEAMLRKSQALDTRSSFNRSRMSLDRPSVEINRKAFGRRAMRSAAVDPNHGVLGPGLWNRKHGLFGHAQGTLQAIISNDPSPLLTSEQKLVSKGDSSREVAKDLDEGTIFERCFQHIDDFATEGLRTLLYGYRFIDEVEYTTWREAYHRATTSLVNRQQMIESVGEVIERDFELAGATAIEDKLQKGVPETVEKLRRANIKIWMLTGDKRETAINIAHSTRICKSYSRLIILDHQNDSEGLQQQITSALLELEVGTVAHSVVVIDGRTLEAIEIQGLTAPLYELLLRVESVICCRATPSQKPPW